MPIVALPARCEIRNRSLLVRPLTHAGNPIDITQTLTVAVAESLWRKHGGNDVINWIEAEHIVHDLLELASIGQRSLQRTAAPAAREIEAKPGALSLRSAEPVKAATTTLPGSDVAVTARAAAAA